MRENGPNSPDLEGKTISKSSDFHDNFQFVAKNIEGFCFFFSLHIKYVTKFD
jgi:hypothetical protein